jgi:hypothetical protein
MEFESGESTANRADPGEVGRGQHDLVEALVVVGDLPDRAG